MSAVRRKAPYRPRRISAPPDSYDSWVTAASSGSFQAIDRVIQNDQPLFLLVWVGSVLSVLTAAGMGLWQLNGADRLLVIVAALVHVLGVQVPTARVNIPLNNAIQKIDPGTMDEAGRKRARADFEARWNRWNLFRTACASLASLVLAILLVRL